MDEIKIVSKKFFNSQREKVLFLQKLWIHSTNCMETDWKRWLNFLVFIWFFTLAGFFFFFSNVYILSKKKWGSVLSGAGKVIKLFKPRFQPVAFYDSQKFVCLPSDWQHNVNKLDMWRKFLTKFLIKPRMLVLRLLKWHPAYPG